MLFVSKYIKMIFFFIFKISTSKRFKTYKRIYFLIKKIIYFLNMMFTDAHKPFGFIISVGIEEVNLRYIYILHLYVRGRKNTCKKIS